MHNEPALQPAREKPLPNTGPGPAPTTTTTVTVGAPSTSPLVNGNGAVPVGSIEFVAPGSTPENGDLPPSRTAGKMRLMKQK
ncbi:hypothetical protein ZHAS_00018293 [Anopheles sinensis]|uniref:Uncharacterized protein n=1 Tax=Anopheles sinensis TaxID=74873 RepID=A0A084WJ28_ANOSI|nr:hypothetical protein ZHAS_00018293 [Anopheles sinensis]